MRGARELLNARASWKSIDAWRRGYRHMPSWAAEEFAVQIGSRARRGLEIEADLLAYAEQRKVAEAQRYGCCVVVDGRNNRLPKPKPPES